MNVRKSGYVAGFICAVVLVSSSLVWAGPQMVVNISTSREKIEMVNGTAVKKLLPTKTAAAGDVLHYTLTYTNKGNEPATSAVIDNPVPKGTAYIANSATGANAEITFSNDEGKTFAPPVKLTYEIKLPNGKTEKKLATPGDYTTIRWTVKRVAPGESGTVGFAVHVK